MHEPDILPGHFFGLKKEPNPKKHPVKIQVMQPLGEKENYAERNCRSTWKGSR